MNLPDNIFEGLPIRTTVSPLDPTTTSDPFDSSSNSSSAWDYAATLFEAPPPYDQDISLWIRDRLKESLWSAQDTVTNSVLSERYTAVQACHGVGKSFIASRVAAWWIDTHPEGEAFVVSTAPTNAQVSAVLWREISKAHRKADLPGRIVTAGYPQWKIGTEIVGYGRKPADYSDSAFQGIHTKYVLVIIDEAGGVSRDLYDAADALATNEFARVLAIGNPDDATSHFANICKPDSGWNVLRIDGLRSPNFTQQAIRDLDCHSCRNIGSTTSLLERLMKEEGIPTTDETIPDELRHYLISPLWVEERLHRWVGRVAPGESVSAAAAQSALFTSKVRGLFPSASSEGVIPLGWIERAMDRWRNQQDLGWTPTGRKILGVDVADTGTDETIIVHRQDNTITRIDRHPSIDTMTTVGLTNASLEGPDPLAIVDVIGVGAGVVSRLREQQSPVRAFNASGSAADMKDRSNEFGFTNQRAWAWWNLRELLDPSKGYNIALPDDEMLKADLSTPKWKVLSGGKIQIESKDEIRKRLGRSPDAGDAVVMAFISDSTTIADDSTSTGAVSWWSDPGSGQTWDSPEGYEALLSNWLGDAETLGDVTKW